jgi:hypothetical protein
VPAEVVRTQSAGARPSGGQRFYARALHVFFGKPFLFVLPALLISMFGVYSATSKPKQYFSVATLSVSSETFLGDLSNVRSADFSFDTPASTITRQFNELMQTDGFATTVIEAAEAASSTEVGLLTLEEVREGVYAAASGDRIMRIVAVAAVPATAQALATSAIATFKNWVIAAEVSGSDVAESFYDQQLAAYDLEVQAASEELTAYLETHPEPINSREQRDIAEQLQIEYLNGQLADAEERFERAFDNRELSRLATLESSADIDQRLNVLDAPSLPTLPMSGLRDLAMTMILFGALGVFFSLALVALATVIDRSVLWAGDLDRLGAPVRAVVPRVQGMSVEQQRSEVSVSKGSTAPLRSVG